VTNPQRGNAHRFLVALALALGAGPGGSPALRSAPRSEEVARPETSVQAEDQERAAQVLFARVAESAGLLGKGSVRVLVLPVSLLQARHAVPQAAITGASPEEAAADEEPQAEPSYWFPNAMVQSTLTDRLVLEEEIGRLLGSLPAAAPVRPGAPSPALIAVLASSHRTAREAARVARAQPAPGGTLGRGVPWKGQEAPNPGKLRETAVGPPRPTASPVPKPGGTGPGKVEAGPAPAPEMRPEPAQETEERYVAVLIQAPFHAFGENPDETIAIELSGEELARVRGKGQEWAWVQLDSGLMGVIRNRFLREAAPGEIERFLALEGRAGTGGGSGMDIGIMDLDAFGQLIQSNAAPEGAAGRTRPTDRPKAEKGSEVEVKGTLE